MICFDIETGLLPDDQLLKLVPAFDEVAAVPDVAPFDESSVKLGNVKDAGIRATKINEARAAHELLARTVATRREEARANHVAKFVEKAALSACTGCVKAIGWWEDGVDDPIIWTLDPLVWTEAEMIEQFWMLALDHPNISFVGHAIHSFDLPFLVRRSWLLSIDVPKSVRNGRYWASQFVDTMVEWGCGSRDYISLDAIDRALGGPGKPDDCTGADFARMFDAGGEEREKALAYLRGDLEMVRRVADAMQLL